MQRGVSVVSKRAPHLIVRNPRGSRCASRRPRPIGRQLAFERLEDRRVLANLTVTTLADAAVTGPNSAPGTLRQAIYDANLSSDADVIEFAANLEGDVSLSVIDDNALGATALVVSSPITIRGNANGIAIARDLSVAELRLIRVTAAGRLTLEAISVTEGLVRGTTGVAAGENGGNALGGAVYNQGTLQIIASTIHSNETIGGDAGAGGSKGGGLGGAIYNDGGTLSVENSTFSGNSAVRSDASTIGCFGGAIYSKNGTVTIHNSTLTNSTAFTGRGLYVLSNNGTATVDIQSTIIGQSDTALSTRELVLAWDINEQFAITGFNNLIRLHNIDQLAFKNSNLELAPLLGPLADNGGPTLTHAFLPDSPAIDSGSNSQNLDADQRGGSYQREIGAATDIGAYESQTAVSPQLPGDYNRNNFVDAADFVLWRMTRGTTVSKYSGADGNGNGEVDDADYGIWREHFGETGPATGAGQSLPSQGVADMGVSSSSKVASESASAASSDSASGIVAIPAYVGDSQRSGQHPAKATVAKFAPASPAAASRLLLRLAGLQASNEPDGPSNQAASADVATSEDVEAVWEAVFDEWPGAFPTR